MNTRHQRTLDAVFATPVRANIEWSAFEALLVALGAKVTERAGSRASVVLNGKAEVFHRPHPQKEASKAVRSVREFLTKAGVKP